jgi:DNA-binding XRE family transcriptional regulator
MKWFQKKKKDIRVENAKKQIQLAEQIGVPEYVRTHQGCTKEEISQALNLSQKELCAQLVLCQMRGLIVQENQKYY